LASGLIIQQANTYHLLELFEETRRNMKSPEPEPKITTEPLAQKPTITEVSSLNSTGAKQLAQNLHQN